MLSRISLLLRQAARENLFRINSHRNSFVFGLFFLVLLIIRFFWGISQIYGNVGAIWLNHGYENIENRVIISKAERNLQQASHFSPNNHNVLRLLGFAFLAQGDVSEAVSVWRVYPKMGYELMEWGKLFSSAQSHTQATAWYDLARLVEPELAGQSYYDIGLSLSSEMRWVDAAESFQQALRYDPEYGDAWYALGMAHLELHEWALSIEAFQKGLSAELHDVGMSDLYFQLGQVYQQFLVPPDREKARLAYEEAVLLDDYRAKSLNRAFTYYARGVLFAEQESWQEALAAYDEAMVFIPNNYSLHILYAEALLQIGERELAEQVALEALALAPNRVRAYRWLGEYYQRVDRIEEARLIFEQILEISPEALWAQNMLDMLADED